jgi:hypothetical protein
MENEIYLHNFFTTSGKRNLFPHSVNIDVVKVNFSQTIMIIININICSIPVIHECWKDVFHWENSSFVTKSRLLMRTVTEISRKAIIENHVHIQDFWKILINKRMAFSWADGIFLQTCPYKERRYLLFNFLTFVIRLYSRVFD